MNLTMEYIEEELLPPKIQNLLLSLQMFVQNLSGILLKVVPILHP